MITEAQKQFIDEIGPIVVKIGKQRGYKVFSAVVAQACIESAFGASTLSKKYHNYFGMKCGSGWKGKSVNMRTKEEYHQGTLTSIRDNLRAYDDMESGVAGYYDFIRYKRYANLKTAATPETYLKRIRADGYATSSSYVNTCLKVVNDYSLRRFDGAYSPAAAGEPTTAGSSSASGTAAGTAEKKTTVPAYKVGHVYTTQVELKVRTGPGTNYRAKKHSELAKSAQAFDKDNDGAIDKGTRVTCLSVAYSESDIWIRIPSGYIAAYYKGKTYVV